MYISLQDILYSSLCIRSYTNSWLVAVTTAACDGSWISWDVLEFVEEFLKNNQIVENRKFVFLFADLIIIKVHMT